MEKDSAKKTVMKKIKKPIRATADDIKDYYKNPPTPSNTQQEGGSKSRGRVPCCPELSLDRLGLKLSNDMGNTALKFEKDPFELIMESIRKNENPDCVVLFSERKFNCYAIVLQCFSRLIDDMDSFEEIHLDSEKCSFETFEMIYKWMINSDNIPEGLTRDNLLSIYIASKYLIIEDLLAVCETILKSWNLFSEATAFRMYAEARKKGVDEIRTSMLQRIQRFFLVLVSAEEWVLLDFKDVELFLKSNFISINNEIEIFYSAMRWLKYDWENRRQRTIELLRCVRWGNLKSWQIINIQRSNDTVAFAELMTNPEIFKMMDEALSYTTFQDLSESNGTLNSVTEQLSLQEPNSRNFSGLNHCHRTFSEFMEFLYMYRKQEFLAKTGKKPKVLVPNLALKQNVSGFGDDQQNVKDNVKNQKE